MCGEDIDRAWIKQKVYIKQKMADNTDKKINSGVHQPWETGTIYKNIYHETLDDLCSGWSNLLGELIDQLTS